MYFDVSGYHLIHNLEKLRLTRFCNVVPAEPNVAMSRGIALHAIIEGHHKDWTRNQMDAALDAMIADGSITEESIQTAWSMWPALLEYFEKRKERVVASEFEFDITLQGKRGEHHLVGRVDAVTELDGVYCVDEYKGMNKPRGTDEAAFKERETVWRANSQCDTEILGSRKMGYPAVGMHVISIVEDTPSRILNKRPLIVTRDDYQLEYTLRSITQWCDMLDWLDEAWGHDEPWPHKIPSIWDSDVRGSCNSLSDTFQCAYRDICGQSKAVWGTDVPDGFKVRQEHLEVMKR